MFKKIIDWFKFYQPTGATWEEWRLFDKRFKEKAPVRYYLCESIGWIEWYLFRAPKEIVWWVKYRTTHRYHVAHTGLKPGYHSVDELILYSVFMLVQNFVELRCARKYKWFYPKRAKVLDKKRCGQEYLKCMQRDEDNAHLRRPFQAILQVYQYWTIERPALLKNIEDLYEDVDIKNRLLWEKIHDQEDLCDKLDKKHLYKVIKYRQYFWT
jgi:hypothetical protein